MFIHWRWNLNRKNPNFTPVCRKAGIGRYYSLCTERSRSIETNHIFNVCLNFEMKIGNRKYQIKSSDFRIVTPDLHLTLDVWSTNPKTYFLGEPIFIENSKNLMDKYEIGFANPQIDLMDSTLLENDNDLYFNDLQIEFDKTNLFQITNVKITGYTRENEKLTIDTKTHFSGFEIWKMDDYLQVQKEFEKWLEDADIKYEIEDDKTNGIIYLKIKNRG